MEWRRWADGTGGEVWETHTPRVLLPHTSFEIQPGNRHLDPTQTSSMLFHYCICSHNWVYHTMNCAMPCNYSHYFAVWLSQHDFFLQFLKVLLRTVLTLTYDCIKIVFSICIRIEGEMEITHTVRLIPSSINSIFLNRMKWIKVRNHILDWFFPNYLN